MSDAPSGDSPALPPFRVGLAAIVGRANVGKSTLLNQLVGEKIAITSPIPQTTRHRILGVRTLAEGQIAFVDTPGVHKPHTALGTRMNEHARHIAHEAEVLLLVIDASEGFGPGDRHVLDMLREQESGRPIILVLNKIDQTNKGRLLPLIQTAVNEWGFSHVVPVSAATGDNCRHLLEVVIEHLPEGPLLYPAEFVSDVPERRMVAEIVREKLLERTRQEVPHSIAVLTEQLERHEDGLIEITVAIYVDKASQKGIVIGHRGRMLKDVGTAARKDLERRFDSRVFLQLWVKVKEGWRDRPALLHDLGLE